ncbi:hypothetical protein C8F04DRAFT_1269436 [Mycena alexandri]|uniref:Uncharacterized protein n=1 Tax=Mycena alexandri TaxID=1745969 RepID=A0AAD6SCA2_9AGAR|nr:hypothetical protein C8F04DRAFT_1269436 [Mycena alexandri]
MHIKGGTFKPDIRPDAQGTYADLTSLARPIDISELSGEDGTSAPVRLERGRHASSEDTAVATTPCTLAPKSPPPSTRRTRHVIRHRRKRTQSAPTHSHYPRPPPASNDSARERLGCEDVSPGMNNPTVLANAHPSISYPAPTPYSMLAPRCKVTTLHPSISYPARVRCLTPHSPNAAISPRSARLHGDIECTGPWCRVFEAAHPDSLHDEQTVREGIVIPVDPHGAPQ